MGLTRTVSGLIYKDLFTSLAGWTSEGSWSSVEDPTFMCFGALPNVLLTPSSRSGVGSEFDGVREPQLYVENASEWFLLYVAGDHFSGWRQQMAKSTDRGLTWTRLGAVSMGLSNGEAGTFHATDWGWFEKRGTKYIDHRLYDSGGAEVLGAVNKGIPSGPYFWDTWEAASPTGPWTFVRKVPLHSKPHAWAALQLLPCCVIKEGETYYAVGGGLPEPEPRFPLDGWLESSSPTGPWTPAATAIWSSTYTSPKRGAENPKVFFHAGMGRWCAIANLTASEAHPEAYSDSNMAITATSRAGLGTAPFHAVQQISVADGSTHIVGVLCHVTEPDGKLVEDSGYVPVVFDTNARGVPGTSASFGTWEIGHDIYGAIYEPSTNALRASNTEAHKSVSRALSHGDFVAEFCVRTTSAAETASEFWYRLTGTGVAANCYRLVLRSGGTPLLQKIVEAGKVTNIAEGATAVGSTVSNDKVTWDRVKVNATGTTHKIWLNGALVIEATDSAYTTGDHVAFSGTNAVADMRLLSFYSSETVTVKELPAGVQINLRTWGDLPVASAVADSTGTATFKVPHGPYKGFEAAGVNYNPSGGVWGGDVYTLTGVTAPGEGNAFPMGEFAAGETRTLTARTTMVFGVVDQMAAQASVAGHPAARFAATENATSPGKLEAPSKARFVTVDALKAQATLAGSSPLVFTTRAPLTEPRTTAGSSQIKMAVNATVTLQGGLRAPVSVRFTATAAASRGLAGAAATVFRTSLNLAGRAGVAGKAGLETETVATLNSGVTGAKPLGLRGVSSAVQRGGGG